MQDMGCKQLFLSILQIRQSLPYNWRLFLTQQNINDQTEPKILLKLISKLIPFTRYKSFQFYQMLKAIEEKNTVPKCISKWNEVFNIDIKEWGEIFLNPFTVCRSTRLQSFQYRLLHRVITCNHWLYNAQLKDSPNCDTCLVDDDLYHFFINCIHVQDFRTSFNQWWAEVTLQPLQLSQQDIIFGVKKSNKYYQTINYVLLLANKFIHDSNIVSRTNVSFHAFLISLKLQLQYEKQICLKNSEQGLFEKKWNWLFEQLE